jgi:hypothetical protein
METVMPAVLRSLIWAVLALAPLSAHPQSAAFVFPQACAGCHGSQAKYPVRGVRTQYLTSGHRNLPDASYSNGDGCQRCHTNEGFIEYATTGKVDPKGLVSNPSEVGCFTCHAPHERGDFSLRKMDAVKLANGAVFDKGKANLCASCHQARVTPKDEVRARPIVAAPWGAHHGPQSDMLLGTNAYEFTGKAYSKSPHAVLPNANCVTCHMTQPAQRYALAPTIGGHSFRLAGEVHEAPMVNVAGCMTSGCHAAMSQVAGKELFNVRASADFDGDGRIETVQEEVSGLLEKLLNKQGTGLLQKAKNPLYDAKGNFILNNKTEQPVEIVAALYNYKFVLEDGSRGVHNTRYAVQLLMDSIKALDPAFDDSKRPQ